MTRNTTTDKTHVIRVHKYGGPDVLKWEEADIGEPGPGEIRIKQMAIAGIGIGWLPLSCARSAIEEGRLVQIGAPEMATDMEILLCRRLGQSHQGVEAIWRHLGE